MPPLPPTITLGSVGFSIGLGDGPRFSSGSLCQFTPRDQTLEVRPVTENVGTKFVVGHFGNSYEILAQHRHDIALLARFATQVESATFYMCAAFAQDGVFAFRFDEEREELFRHQKARSWLEAMANQTFGRFRILRRALIHEWEPSPEVEPLAYAAFLGLCELTPAAEHQLKRLFYTKRGRAIQGLVGQLDLVAKQLEGAVDLTEDLNTTPLEQGFEDDQTRLRETQDAILVNAGEALSLTEAAAKLAMSRQNLHKRIHMGSALGIMRGNEIVVPSIQFVEHDGHLKIVPDLKKIISIFTDAKAGVWSAFQFLVEKDPMLADVPIEKLKRGDTGAVIYAARAYLGLDES